MAAIGAKQLVIEGLLKCFVCQAEGERNHVNGRFQGLREKAFLTNGAYYIIEARLAAYILEHPSEVNAD